MDLIDGAASLPKWTSVALCRRVRRLMPCRRNRRQARRAQGDVGRRHRCGPVADLAGLAPAGVIIAMILFASMIATFRAQAWPSSGDDHRAESPGARPRWDPGLFIGRGRA